MPDPYTRTTYDGRTVDWLTRAALEAVSADLYGKPHELTLLQGSYNAGGVGASKGTHDGGGVVDLIPNDWRRKVASLRRHGFAAWHRPAIPGLWGEHIHAVLKGNRRLSPAAAHQVTEYLDGENGLANHARDDGPRDHVNAVFHYPERLMLAVNLKNVREQFLATATNHGRPRPLPGVRRIQRCLNARYNTGLTLDGVAGPATVAAYRHHETVTGVEGRPGVPDAHSLPLLLRGTYRTTGL